MSFIVSVSNKNYYDYVFNLAACIKRILLGDLNILGDTTDSSFSVNENN